MSAVPPQSPTATAWEVVRFLGLCSLWLACSCAIILVNKLIIKEVGFAFPIAVSALGQGTSFLVAWAICEAAARPASEAQEGELQPLTVTDGVEARVRGAASHANHRPAEQPGDQQRGGVTTAFWAWRVVPVGVAQGVGIFLSNKLYLLLTVAFIEMARSLLPLLTLLALWGAGLRIPDRSQIAAVLLSAVGCGISAYGEARLTIAGVICLAINFAVEIVRMVLLQYLIQEVKLGPWHTVKAVTGPASASLLMLMVIVEGKFMVRAHAERIVVQYWPAFLAAATCGVATNFITNLVVQFSSATTVKLLAAIRGPLVVVCGVLLFGELVGTLQMLGYALALCGFVWYSHAARASGVGLPAPIPLPKPMPAEVDADSSDERSRLLGARNGATQHGST